MLLKNIDILFQYSLNLALGNTNHIVMYWRRMLHPVFSEGSPKQFTDEFESLVLSKSTMLLSEETKTYMKPY